MAAFLAAAAVILGLSLYPRPEDVLGPLTLWDKADHFAAYAALAFLGGAVVARQSLPRLAVIVIACVAFGGLVEMVQPLVGRQRDLVDFLANLAGCVLGALGWIVVARIRRRGSKSGNHISKL